MANLVSVVVPFYNEVANVRPLWERIETVFVGLPDYMLECVFVDDGSTDGTGEELERLAAENPHIRPLRFSRNFGQSAALVAGMRAARGRYVLTLDGDLQNDPADFPKLLTLLQDYDCVCGVRVDRQDTWVRRLSSRVANAVRGRLLQDGVRDAGCGTKGFRRECIDHFVCFNGAHRFFAVMVRAAGFSLVECPVTHHPRHSGQSKYGVGNRLWRGIYDLIGVAWLRRRYVIYEVEPNSVRAKADIAEDADSVRAHPLPAGPEAVGKRVAGED